MSDHVENKSADWKTLVIISNYQLLLTLYCIHTFRFTMGHIYADAEAQLCLLGWNYIVIVVISHNGDGNPIY